MRIWDMDNDPNSGLYRSRSLDSLQNAMGMEGPYNSPYIDQSPYTSQPIPSNSFQQQQQQQQPYPWLSPTGLSGMMPNGLSGIQPSPFGSPGPSQFIPSSSQSIPIGPTSFQQPIQPGMPQQFGATPPGLLQGGFVGGLPGLSQAPPRKHQPHYDQFMPDPPEPPPPLLGAIPQLPLGPLPPGENIFTRESAKMLKRNRNTVIGITIASILLAAALAGIIVLVVGFNAIPPTTPTTTQISFKITRTDLTFGAELSNPLGYNFATTAQTFCDMILNSYLRGIFAVNSCVVAKLETGSISAFMIIGVVNLGAEGDTIFSQVASTIVAKSDADPSVLPVTPSSIQKLSFR